MATHILNKSTYMLGVQCEKALYLSKTRRDLVPPTDPLRQAVLEAGTEVGCLAQQLFPGGVDLRPATASDFGLSLEATRAAIARGERVIYEAAFVHEGVMVALDILVQTDEGWSAYEVKSSGGVKDSHVQDAALQAQVIEGNGVALVSISVIHLNTGYVREGPVDAQGLFTISSIVNEVASERARVAERIANLKAVLSSERVPDVKIGPHCNDPVPCNFRAHCWAEEPKERSVLTLTRARGREWALHARGVRVLEAVPDDEPLSVAQRRQVDGWKTGQISIDLGELRRWVSALSYPLRHFDFETFAAAVPPFDRARPYQQIPFQYSVHTQDSVGAEPTHRFFLGDGRGDPREALTQQMLLDLGEEGDLLTYHASFERGRIQELARDLPHHAAALDRLVPRIKDLEVPFLEGWYYAPAMNGRTSIKQVLPALVPGLSYHALSIQEGGTASFLYGQLESGKYGGDVAELRADLLAYCELDTLAMVKILGVLERSARSE